MMIKTLKRSLNEEMLEINIFDNVKIQRGETFSMDVVIWTKNQVQNNQRVLEPVTFSDIHLENQKV